MKRLGVTVLGFLFGLFLTWLCLYAEQFIPWHPLRHVTWLHTKHGDPQCLDLEHCSHAPWWLYVVMVAFVFGPAIVFAAMNFRAWKRWPLAKWCKWQACLIVVATTIYVLGEIS